MEREGDLFIAALPADAKIPRRARLFRGRGAGLVSEASRHVHGGQDQQPRRQRDIFSRTSSPGVGTELQSSPPAVLSHPKETFLRLKTDESDEWRSHVLSSGELTVFLRDCPSDVGIWLVVVTPGAALRSR